VSGEGPFQEVELEHEFPGAGRRTVRLSGSAIPAPVGAPLILLAIEDVTRQRDVARHRAELLALSEEARAKAEAADRTKDLFLANLSHELRTPLTAILLQAELLQKGSPDEERLQRAGAAIEASTRRQVALVEDLLDVSRIVAGKLRLDRAAVDWRALVRAVVETTRPAAEAKGVRLEASLDGEALGCQGDAGRLQQVVSNLLSNAVKFTPGGGRVEVRCDAVDGQVRLVVADTGRGIAPDFLPHVFERFAQEDGSQTHHPGLGLGLAIAHDLVRLHGGEVLVQSPGRDLGSTFTVTLPRGDGAAEHPV
jgi:signal transduction histidine kinase